MYLSAPRRRRGEEGWEGAPRCTLDTHRHRKQAKGAGRLGPQGHWSGPKDSPAPCHGHTRYRWTERAFPIRCDCDGTWQPRTSPARESAPQGEPTGVRAWEDGRSEGHSVMGWRGVAPTGNMTPRESVLTSIWSCITREFGQPPEERRQRTAVVTRTGALSHRMTVRGLQARRVKVVSQHVLDVAAPRSARGVGKA